MKSIINVKKGLVQKLVKSEALNNIEENNHSCFRVPKGVWGSNEYYLWDNWIVDSRKYDGKIHRYSLFSPKIVNGKELYCHDRHVHALIRHAYSTDNGDTWKDTGSTFSRESIGNICQMLWSGSTIVRELEDKSYQFVMFLTASRGSKFQFYQKIGVSYSNDGENWSPLKICLEFAPKYNYSLSAEDGEDPAWRDPYVWQDPNNKEWYMFFCTKKINKDGKLVPCVGMAKATKEFDEWELLPGLEVPIGHQQLEMPAIVYYHKHYYLFCCGQTTSTVVTTANYYAFVSQGLSENDEWKCVYASEDDSKNNDWDHLFGKIFYGTSIFVDVNGDINAAAFHASDYTLTPIIPITWNYQVHPPQPSIQYNLIHATYGDDTDEKSQDEIVEESLSNDIDNNNVIEEQKDIQLINSNNDLSVGLSI